MSSMAETLAGLGGTAGEVADSLRRLGVKGRQRRACDCPLARRLMMDARADLDRISVSWCSAARYGREDFEDTEQCPLPKPCADFVIEFDGGHYPDLVEDNV